MASKKNITKSKLIRLISTFSALEWKRFGRFLQSPYHNSNERLFKLYSVLKKLSPFDSEEQLGQEVLFRKVFEKEDFRLSKLQNLCSDLYKLTEAFLVDLYLQKEKRKRKQLLIEALSERDYELYKGVNQKLIQEVETQVYFLDEEDFLLLYQLNHNLHHHLETDTYTIHQTASEKAWNNLQSFYEDASSQIEAENNTTQNFLKIKKELAYQNTHQLKDLFLEVASLQKSQETTLYFEFKEKVLKNWSFLKPKHKTNLLVHLINFSFKNEYIRKAFGHTEALSLYKIGIKDKLFIINGKMRDTEFLNIAMIGFWLNEFDWTEQFIQSHQQYLSKDLQSFLLPLVYAYKANFEKNYELVIDLLSQLKPSNQLVYRPKIKGLLIRAYFEGIIRGQQHYLSPLNYEIASFKKMMSRNHKLSSLKINAYTNFLDLTKQLIAICSNKPYDLNKLLTFELVLLNTSPLILKNWLQEKLSEIKNAASL